MYSKSLTQGDCSRMSAGSGNRTSAPVQALDHKSNSLPLRHCAWLPILTKQLNAHVCNRVKIFEVMFLIKNVRGNLTNRFDSFRVRFRWDIATQKLRANFLSLSIVGWSIPVTSFSWYPVFELKSPSNIMLSVSKLTRLSAITLNAN